MMYGETRDAFLKADRVWVHLLPDAEGNRETWVGKIVDAQESGLVVRVLSVNVNGRPTGYVERDCVELRFLAMQQVKYVTVREES